MREQDKPNYQMTTIAPQSYRTKICVDENKKTYVHFDVWDTAGEEKYRSIGKLYYKSANAAIIVYDITRAETFESIKNYWYDEILNNTSEGTGNLNYFKFIYYSNTNSWK